MTETAEIKKDFKTVIIKGEDGQKYDVGETIKESEELYDDSDNEEELTDIEYIVKALNKLRDEHLKLQRKLSIHQKIISDIMFGDLKIYSYINNDQ